MNKSNKSVYDIAFDKRAEEARRLELQRAEIQEEIEGAMAEYAKLSKKRYLKRKSKIRVTSLLLEGKDSTFE